MEESSTGAVVPAVEGDVKEKTVVSAASKAGEEENAKKQEELDKDLLCPICMQIITDAFLTSCGHSFCYMCIVTHLQNKSDCPCCFHYLTPTQLYPNFLLDKVLNCINCNGLAISFQIQVSLILNDRNSD